MEERRLNRGCWASIAALLAVLVVIAGGFWLMSDSIRRQFAFPDPKTVAQVSLEGLREQNRLSAFAARYVAVVSSRQSRLGLSAEKTLIMPGGVRYEVDLSRLKQGDLAYDPATTTLTVTLPPIEVVGPDINLDHVREYSAGGILARLTNVEEQLDEANRKAGQAELLRQAREATPMNLARDATRRAVANSFLLPLKAVGVEAKVQVRFADEPQSSSERWDVSRSISDVLSNR